MSGKLSDVTFEGKSGQRFKFGVYDFGVTFQPGYPAVYFVTNRYRKSDGKHTHERIYIGQTDDLAVKLENHRKLECFQSFGANCICVFGEPDATRRAEIHADLLERYSPPCNG